MAIEVNKKFYTWHDLEFSVALDGAAREILVDIVSLSFGHSVEKTNVYGAGRAPLGQATGQYILDETTIELHKAQWETLKAQIGEGYLQADIALSVRYADLGDESPIQQVDIEGTLKGESESLAISNDSLVVPVLILPTLIRTNGRLAYSDSF